LIQKHSDLFQKYIDYKKRKIKDIQRQYNINVSSTGEQNSMSTTISNLEQPLLESTTIELQQQSQLQQHQHQQEKEDDEIRYVRELSSFVDSDIPIKARIYNYPTITKIKQLNSNMYNNFVSISGTVVRVGTMQPYSVRMAFKCPKCDKHFVNDFLIYLCCNLDPVDKKKLKLLLKPFLILN